jgi:5-methylcytosine-specific restriction endonuclease McrA
MDKRLERQVWQRAAQACEYCRVPQSASRLPLHVEHIIARQHGGKTKASNLAIACPRCNLHKGPNLSGIDPRTGGVVRLYNPRRHKWERHFRWSGPYVVGRTATGRATITVLAMNDPGAVEVRRELIAAGTF